RKTAACALDDILKLLHAYMPFISEDLCGSQSPRDGMLIGAKWPSFDARLANEAAASEMNWTIGLISAIRSIRTEINAPAGAKVPLVAVALGAKEKARLAAHADIVSRLARLSLIDHAAEAPKGAVQIVHDGAVFALPLEGVIDIGAEKARLEKEIAKAADEIARIDKKLANESFVAKAPPEVVEEQRARREDYAAQGEKFALALARLKDL
ncbi:MAG: class I tRNA ligase family protein, partial [Amphiplicatus sp.]